MKNLICNDGIVLQIALKKYQAQWIKSAISFLVYSGERALLQQASFIKEEEKVLLTI